jgi:hypothetical protein
LRKEPEGPYIYQPFGSVTHQEHASCGRLYGVAGVSILTEIKGLTKAEAEAVRLALLRLRADPLCPHGLALDLHCCRCGRSGFFSPHEEAADCPEEMRE